MFTRKPRLQLEKFAINGAKRLLQHNRHLTELPILHNHVRLARQAGHHLNLPSISADDPPAT